MKAVNYRPIKYGKLTQKQKDCDHKHRIRLIYARRVHCFKCNVRLKEKANERNRNLGT